MLFGIFSRTGQSDALRAQLDASAQRTRDIAGRVARASISADGRGGFSLNSPDGDPAADGDAGEVNIENEMASLADEQLRYDATAKLLEQTYTQFRRAPSPTTKGAPMSSPIPPIITPSVQMQPSVLRPMFQALRIASSGLSAQQFRMDVVAQNLANSETTRTADGGPYQRRTVSMQATPLDPNDDTSGGVQVTGLGTDTSEGPKVYDPGHPDADADGFVHMPNVSTTDEMLDLMNAHRNFEANATVFEVAKAMLHSAINI